MSVSEAAGGAESLANVRARIAGALLGANQGPARVGDVTLYPHQRQAVHRLRTLLRVHRGAMLADATGLGKTFVALAIASEEECVAIIAPASLTNSWRHSLTRTGVAATIVSIEQLSRDAGLSFGNASLIVVDEAHHLRNPRTKRYSAVATACEGARVLLLTATPLQNRRADLVAQLALFLGDTAYSASDEELSRLIVRRSADSRTLPLPAVRGPTWITLPVEDDLLDELLALPPAVPGADEGDGGALVVYSLLRQWASSRAALTTALRRRLGKAIALTTSLEAGRWPTRDELGAWTCASDAMQLAFPELLGPEPPGARRPLNIDGLLETIRHHAEGVRGLLTCLRATPNPDPARARALADICARHAGRRVLAFSQYAETVRAISRLLMCRQSGVAELTASGGRVAGGRLGRRDILFQFGPGNDSASRSRHEQIDLLVTTDVLSEGLDLQGASVVVHLDLPWNPARLAQRVGRVRRLGSEHAEVFVYAIEPPAASERVLQVERRLRAKLREAARIVGLDASALDTGIGTSQAVPELSSNTLAKLEEWLGAVPRIGGIADVGVFAAASAPDDGLLALVVVNDEPLLLAGLADGALSADACLVDRVVQYRMFPDVAPTPMEIAGANAAVSKWFGQRLVRRELARPSVAGARVRRRLATAITTLLANTPRHRRAALMRLASAARGALHAPFGAGGERRLFVLAQWPERDENWLREIAAVGARTSARGTEASSYDLVAAIILRRPVSAGASRAT